VLDSSGNVLGMVATAGSLNDQMIVRGCIPSQSLLELTSDSDFGTPEEVHDPLATERACLKTTFAAMQQLAQQQGKISPKEFNERLAELAAVMQHTVKMCPGDPIAKRYAKAIESGRKLRKAQLGEEGGAHQPATAPDSKSKGADKPKPDSKERSQ